MTMNTVEPVHGMDKAAAQERREPKPITARSYTNQSSAVKVWPAGPVLALPGAAKI